jgi:hypothetical protein
MSMELGRNHNSQGHTKTLQLYSWPAEIMTIDEYGTWAES